MREEAEELEYYRHAAGASGGEADPLAPDSRVFARSAMSYGTVLAGGLALAGRAAWRRVRLDGDGGDANCRVSELEPVVEWRDSGDGMLRVLARIAARDYDETGAPREPPRAASERVSRRVAGNDAAAPNDHQERETLSNGMIVGTLVVVFSPRIQTQGRRARIMGEKAGGWVEVRFIDDSTIASFRKYELRAPDQSARPALVPPSAHAPASALPPWRRFRLWTRKSSSSIHLPERGLALFTPRNEHGPMTTSRARSLRRCTLRPAKTKSRRRRSPWIT